MSGNFKDITRSKSKLQAYWLVVMYYFQGQELVQITPDLGSSTLSVLIDNYSSHDSFPDVSRWPGLKLHFQTLFIS